MKAMLVVKVKDGYAVAPFIGEIPADFVQGMSVAELVQHSYRECIARTIERYFADNATIADVVQLRDAA